MSGIGPSPHSVISNVGPEHLPEPWVKLFEHFAEYERLYRILLGRKGSSWFVTKMRAYLADAMSERVQQSVCSSNGKHIADTDGYVSTLISALFIETIIWWLEHGRPQTPRQIAMRCSLLASSVLKEVSTWE